MNREDHRCQLDVELLLKKKPQSFKYNPLRTYLTIVIDTGVTYDFRNVDPPQRFGSGDSTVNTCVCACPILKSLLSRVL